MFEKALSGPRNYWLLVCGLLTLIGIGFAAYMYQLAYGLGVTGMNRDVTWGFYIAQFTFLVGVAASAVMLVIPYYLHDYKKFGKVVIFGEFLAVGSVIMCITFVTVDLGQPSRVFNLFLYPSPNSVMFYDIIVLFGYLVLNAIIGWTVLHSEYKQVPPPKWTKPLIYLSIPWAVSIHTVTAFLFSGLAARHFWATAILAPRFIASAFASGPALLILLLFLVRKFSKFDPGKEAIQKIAQIVCYAMIVNVFFVLVEFFVAYYGKMPAATEGLDYLFFGLARGGEVYAMMVPYMWTAAVMAIAGILLLLVPKWRHNENLLGLGAALIFVGAWIDKGVGLMVAGFSPTMLHTVTDYVPSGPELAVTIGVYGIGFLAITLLYKIAIGVKTQN